MLYYIAHNQAMPRAYYLLRMGSPHHHSYTAFSAVGAPSHIMESIDVIFGGGTPKYGTHYARLTRGIQERCPMFPALFGLVHKSFYTVPAEELLWVHFFILRQ